jgi:hypothetical protein
MTSTTIYTPITPTYLYIKQHSITGLKYFGKTTCKDPYKYKGSGSYWSNHIKKYGKEHVTTLWVSELYYNTSIVEYALNFSKENNIVESKEWANLESENGLNGGGPRSDETKAKMSTSQKGKIYSNETRAKLSAAQKGKPKSNKTKAKISIAQKGKPLSDEHKAKISATKKGKPQSAEHIAKRLATKKYNHNH